MVMIPTLAEEDGKRPSRERATLVGERTRIVNRMKSTLARFGIRGVNPKLRKTAEHLSELRTPEGTPLPPETLAELHRDLARLALVREQIQTIERSREQRVSVAPTKEPHAMIRLLARVVGISLETADMLVQEILGRPWRDRRAVARYAGLTGAPDESGARRREKGLARAGNMRVRVGMIQLAWRFLRFQKESALVKWYQHRTEGTPKLRKPMVVALARKLLLALWTMVRTGEVPEGVVLRPA